MTYNVFGGMLNLIQLNYANTYVNAEFILLIYSKCPVVPKVRWQVWRPPYQSAEIWAVDFQEDH